MIMKRRVGADAAKIGVVDAQQRLRHLLLERPRVVMTMAGVAVPVRLRRRCEISPPLIHRAIQSINVASGLG